MSKENHIHLILNGLKLHYNFKTNTDFAKFLGIAPQTLGSWYSRCSVDYDLLYAKCVDIDANWLLSGTGSMLRNDKIVDDKLIKIENESKPDGNCHFKIVMERNETLAVENYILKQEVEQLKLSRGKSTNPPNYDLSSEKIGTHIAAEPRTY